MFTQVKGICMCINSKIDPYFTYLWVGISLAYLHTAFHYRTGSGPGCFCFVKSIVSSLLSALLAHLHTNLRATNTQIKHCVFLACYFCVLLHCCFFSYGS